MQGATIATLRMVASVSPVAGHVEVTSSPEPFQDPSYTPGSGLPSVGIPTAERTREAREERYRRAMGVRPTASERSCSMSGVDVRSRMTVKLIKASEGGGRDFKEVAQCYRRYMHG